MGRGGGRGLALTDTRCEPGPGPRSSASAQILPVTLRGEGPRLREVTCLSQVTQQGQAGAALSSATLPVLGAVLSPRSPPPRPLNLEVRGSRAPSQVSGTGASAPPDTPGQPASGQEGPQEPLWEAGQDGGSCWPGSRGV